MIFLPISYSCTTILLCWKHSIPKQPTVSTCAVKKNFKNLFFNKIYSIFLHLQKSICHCMIMILLYRVCSCEPFWVTKKNRFRYATRIFWVSIFRYVQQEIIISRCKIKKSKVGKARSHGGGYHIDARRRPQKYAGRVVPLALNLKAGMISA